MCHRFNFASMAVLIAIMFSASSAWAVCAPSMNPDNRVTCLTAADKACTALGESKMDGDGKNIIACLNNDNGTLEWRAMTSLATPQIVEYCSAVVKAEAVYTDWAKCPNNAMPINLYCKVEGTGWGDGQVFLGAGAWSIATNHHGQIGNQIDPTSKQIKCWDNGQQVGLQACVTCFK